MYISLFLSFQGHTRLVSSVAVTSDSRTAVSGSWDNSIRVWDLVTHTCRGILNGHYDQIYSVNVSNDGFTLVSSGEDQTIIVWDLTSAEKRLELKVCTSVG